MKQSRRGYPDKRIASAFFMTKNLGKTMKERIIAIEVNLRRLLERMEKLRDIPLSYEVLAKIQKIKLKVDELSDLIIEIEAGEEL